MKKENFKLMLLTSLFWLAVLGVVILVQYTYSNAYQKGMVEGIRTVKLQIK